MRAIWFSNLLNLRYEGIENIHFLAVALHERLQNLPKLVLTNVALYLSRLLNVFLVIVDGLQGFTDCGSDNLLSNVHLVGLKRVLLTHRSQVLPNWKQSLHLQLLKIVEGVNKLVAIDQNDVGVYCIRAAVDALVVC